MRICFVCNTPYQILNCINYVYHKKKEQVFEADIYIGKNFTGVEELSNRLSETGLFEKLFMYEMPQLHGPRKRLRKLIELKFPQKYIRRVLPNDIVLRKDYTQVWCAVSTEFSMAMLFLCKNAEMIHFDDGLGSYRGNLNEVHISTIRKRAYAALGMDLKRLVPKALYVNNPNFCKSKLTSNICALPDLKTIDEKLRNILNSVFLYHGNEYYAKYILVYLTHPEEPENNEEIRTEFAVVDMLKKYSKDVLVRPHPRQRSMIIEELDTDICQDMWELVCAEQITDEHILVGRFSTAQFVPKFIFNKEPFLIFTHHLYEDAFSKRVIEEYESLIDGLKLIYQSPDKIMVPQNLDELKKSMETVMQENTK